MCLVVISCKQLQPQSAFAFDAGCAVSLTSSTLHVHIADKVDAAEGTAADTEALGGAKTKAAVDALLAQLPKCISRDLCDELSVNFCYVNSKAARKRLVRIVCETHRSKLQLLPFYARIAATLSQVFADVAAAVLKAQEDEFSFLQVRLCSWCDCLILTLAV